MRKILFMMLMLFSVSSFAGNSWEDESTERDVVLKEEGRNGDDVNEDEQEKP